jgi:sugar lactone lactonase YvrE
MSCSRFIRARIPAALCLLVLVPLAAVRAQSVYTAPYTFTTFAGTGGRTGNVDGPAAAARFSSPFGIAVDGAGNVYVADNVTSTIRRITPAGEVTTFAGSPGQPGSADGTAAAARFNSPTAIAIDGNGNFFVADNGNHTIRRIAPDGAVTTFAGAAGQLGSANGAGAAARFRFPTGVAVDGAGNVFVADSRNATIRRIAATGVVSTIAGTAEAFGSVDGNGPSARFVQPVGIASDLAGTVYVADISTATIRRVATTGVVTTFAGSGASGNVNGTGLAASFAQPAGIAIDNAGNLYVSSASSHVIRRITPAAVVTTLAGTAGASGSTDAAGAAARFAAPRGTAVDRSGNLFVADTGNQTIRRITPAGIVSTFAGTPGSLVADGTGTAAGFRGPVGIAADAGGTLFVSDISQTIRRITPAAVVTTFAGQADVPGRLDATGTEARFTNPLGLTVDATGEITLVSAQFVRRIGVDGVVTTLAGSATTGTADGTGTNAQFSLPRGIAVDSARNFYVTDGDSHTIRRITPAGVVTTFAGAANQAGSADGTGTAARFNSPRGIAADAANNLYVADGGNHTIRKISPAGVVTTLAGSPGQAGSADGPGGAARFDQPRGLAVDRDGQVFVIDYNNHTVRRITPAGTVSTVAGAPAQIGNVDDTGAAARFNFPNDIAVDAAGALYVTDFSNYSIRRGVPAAAPPPPGPAGAISNLSVRTTLAAGQTLIMGFTMQGGAKQVLLRAVGPGLAQFNLPGTMADPRLTLFQGATQLQANDNWGGGAALAGAFTAVGAFGLPAASLDAALLRAVEGSHTAQVTGPGAGIVLVEAYDAGTGFAPRLTNVSARNRAGTGGDVLIAGFTIVGTEARNLLIRAIGPTLAAFGVGGTLADPKLEIYSGATKIAENDTWASSLAATFDSVGAFQLTPGSRDAALVIALQPGSYTVQVAGADGGTGEALVELYELP